jgi:2,4-dienoyl-CoA reductase-like NADH-dependent reductase (Old Yellow Enzyme family)
MPSLKSAADVCLLLQSPVDLPCGLTLPNRIVKAATTEHFAGLDRLPNDLHRRLYDRWAAGGAGLLITGNATVDARHLEGLGNVAIEDSKVLPTLSEWAKSVHGREAKFLVQLVHPGALAIGSEPVSPSGIWHRGVARRFSRPRELSTREITEVIARFARAAQLACQAGFHGVEIHSAHGFLLNQFLSRRTNLRRDEWGGKLENRLRLLLEIVASSRSAIGSGRILAVKLNSSDYVSGGLTESESLEIAAALDAAGIDILEISGGSYETAAMWGSERPANVSSVHEFVFSEYAAEVRRHTQNACLMATGGMRTASGMAAAITELGVDLIGLARTVIIDPDLPKRLLSGGAKGADPLPQDLPRSVFGQLQWYQNQMYDLAMRGNSARLQHLS